jgi:alpha-1,6-mannosyltransferase
MPASLAARLVILGDGGMRKMFQQSVEKSGARIAFPGFVSDRHELAIALASSDVYVSAMPYETFGISIIEAQACGLPVVGVHAGAMPERVPAELGLLGDKGDASQLANNMEKILRSSKRKTMGQRARTHVKSRFSWDQTFHMLFDQVYPKAQAQSCQN